MNILVIGADGMAGSMVSRYLSNYHTVTPWRRKDLDASTLAVPNLRSFDYVINCVGLIKQKSNNPSDLYTINRDFPEKLSKQSSKLIHLSSDCVFSGKLPFPEKYAKTFLADAEDHYGKSKRGGEMIDNAMILRTSIIGPAKDNSGLFEWFRGAGDTVSGFRKHYWTGVTTLELAKTIKSIVENGLYQPTLFQIAINPVSKLELLTKINTHYNLNKVIIPVDTEEINRSLDTDFQVSDIDTQLLELKRYI